MNLILYVDALDALVILTENDIITDEVTEAALTAEYLRTKLPSCGSFDFILIGEL